MPRLLKPLSGLPVLICLSLASISFSASADLEGLQAAVDAEHRTADEKARDKFRNPAETLAFFGVEPDMAVAEISPGNRGWYTNILAPYLRDEGKYVAVIFDRAVTEGYAARANKEFMERYTNDPGLYGEFEITDFASDGRDIAPEGSMDRVLTFRNTHGWMGSGYADKMMAAMFRALKPGGMMGFVQHRQDGDTQIDMTADNGYVAEAHAIALAEAAGFELADRSEVNANPADTKDHAGGVWTLPPICPLKIR